jgi:hypothetical protein
MSYSDEASALPRRVQMAMPLFGEKFRLFPLGGHEPAGNPVTAASREIRSEPAKGPVLAE